MKDGEFLDQLSDYQLSEIDSDSYTVRSLIKLKATVTSLLELHDSPPSATRFS
jgi:hypothetical protein